MILVTGAAGYIGSQIVHTLHRMHDQPPVMGLDNFSAGDPCPTPEGVKVLRGATGNGGLVGELIYHYDVRAVIHCAASTVVPESVTDPLGYYRNNVADTMALVEVCAKNGIKNFIFSSSCAVYGLNDLAGGRPVKEDDPCRPTSPYGRSKLMIEQYLKDVHEATGMNVVCLRYFNVAGADPLGLTGDREGCTRLIPAAVRAAMGGDPLKVYGTGHDLRDYIHVSDVANINATALAYMATHEPGYLVLNVGRGKGYSVNDIVDAVEYLKQSAVPRLAARRREGDAPSIYADVRAIQDKFNWRPQYDLHDMVEHTIQWETNRKLLSR